uniref:Uncharacterized protein n=1 Tax=Setaria viridis TaxID=4556 RepID=A0A4U6WM90_SETVI|nr:hypothetical protein SEVIR_1G189801v2 [Setaria viridis]
MPRSSLQCGSSAPTPPSIISAMWFTSWFLMPKIRHHLRGHARCHVHIVVVEGEVYGLATKQS